MDRSPSRRRECLVSALDALMERENEIFVRTIPRARHLTDPLQGLSESYYIRHRIETVHRIRLTSRIDALALAAMVTQDYEAARIWSRYAVQELNHDALFLKDLEAHGVTKDCVLRTEPFPATRAMVQYLEEHVRTTGPLAAVAYSLFVEWNSERYSGKAVEKAAVAFAQEFVRGARAHLEVDASLDHYAAMVDVADRLLGSSANTEVLRDLIQIISAHFRDYFLQLHEETLNGWVQSVPRR